MVIYICIYEIGIRDIIPVLLVTCDGIVHRDIMLKCDSAAANHNTPRARSDDAIVVRGSLYNWSVFRCAAVPTVVHASLYSNPWSVQGGKKLRVDSCTTPWSATSQHTREFMVCTIWISSGIRPCKWFMFVQCPVHH